MKRVQQRLIVSLLALLTCVATWAQEFEATGTIISATDDEPLVGASILEVGTNNGCTANLDGNFKLKVAKEGAKLRISFMGCVAQELPAAKDMHIVLEDDNKVMEEVVVTGYLTEKKCDLTGAVSVVKMKDITDTPTANVMSSLQGRVAGMNVTTDGTPGGGNTGVSLRGVTSINNAAPLYVIDGVPTHDNIASILSSNEVESIQVLKDASSAAIYGAQAAAGVIIITTKKAKEGEVKVDFDMSLSAQTFATGLDLLDAHQWGDVYWQAFKNTYGTTPNSTVYGNGPKAQLQDYYYDRDGKKIRCGNTNWSKELFNTALMQNYNLSLSKGFKDADVAFSFNYINQDGLCRNTDYERFNSRLASNFKMLDGKLRIGESVAINRWTQHLNPAGIEEMAVAQHPAIPIYDEQGGYAGGYIDILGDKPNLIRLTDNEANNRHANWRIFGNAYLEADLLKGLTYRSNFGVNYCTGFNSTYVPRWSEGDRNVGTNELTVRQDNSFQWIWSNTLNYRRDFGKHSINALLGMESKKENGEHVLGYGQGLTIDDPDYRYLDAVTSAKNVGNNASNYAMVSYFGKANYAYADKYLASFTLRRDASSRFGRFHRSGYFPSVSAGWRMTQEKFMQKTTSWLDDLKIRASWGINGNDQIDNSATYSRYVTDLNRGGYNLNGDGSTLVPGAIREWSANDNLRWEQTTQLNFGIDAAFLNNRLLWTFDFYNKQTSDMLMVKQYIAVIGEGGYHWYNAAAMNNKGFETTLTWRDHKKDFNYDVTFNLSYYKNEVTGLPEDVYYTAYGGNGVDKSIVGQSLGSWMAYKADGVFRTQKEVDDYVAKYDVQIGAPGVGRIRYADLNGDGKINSADQDWQGTDLPKVIAGLNFGCSWKGFDLSMFFNGMVRKAWNNFRFYTDLFQGWTGNHSTHLLDAMKAWENYETSGVYASDIPVLTVVDSNSETRGSTFFIEDGSYIKLKTFTLGYTLPEKVLKPLHMSRARVYFQAQNLFTITSYTGADPEGLGYTYPLPRTFTFGLSLGL